MDLQKIEVVLASASPRRKELLGLLTSHFSIEPSQADENAPEMPPHQLVELLARRKAQSVAVNRRKALVIGADTIVVLAGQVLGKPQSPEDARRMLGLLSGKTHQVYTGVCLCLGQRENTFHEVTAVTFTPMSHEEISWYVSTGEPMDKAGAYGVQGGAARFISGIQGDFFNVMGLPVHRLYRCLQNFLSQTLPHNEEK